MHNLFHRPKDYPQNTLYPQYSVFCFVDIGKFYTANVLFPSGRSRVFFLMRQVINQHEMVGWKPVRATYALSVTVEVVIVPVSL